MPYHQQQISLNLDNTSKFLKLDGVLILNVESKAMTSLENQDKYFKLNVIDNREPVQLFKDGCDAS